MPGHKGLYGPQGTGLLLCRATGRRCWPAARAVPPARRRCRRFCPTAWKPGPTTSPAQRVCWRVCGFCASGGWSPFAARRRPSSARRRRGFPGCRRSRSMPPRGRGSRAGVLSFRLPQTDPGWVAEALSRRGNRRPAGLHCAPLATPPGARSKPGRSASASLPSTRAGDHGLSGSHAGPGIKRPRVVLDQPGGRPSTRGNSAGTRPKGLCVPGRQASGTTQTLASAGQ